jgi:hypothetical protein
MKLTHLETPLGIPEFELQSKSIARHGVATNGAGGAGTGPTPGTHLMLPWQYAGANRRAGFST